MACLQYKRSVVFAFILATWCFTSQSQRAQRLVREEQTVFSAEDGTVERAVAVPETILGVLRRTEKISLDDLASSPLVASEIRLGGAREVGLIIIGVGFRGAHSAPFWLFRKTTQGYDLLLAIRCDELEVLNGKSHAHRDIAVYRFGEANGSTTLYRFDGTKYRKFKTIRGKSR